MDCRVCNKPVDKDTQHWVEFFSTDDPQNTRAIEHDECNQKKQREQFEEDGRITTSLMMSANLKTYRARHGEDEAKVVDWQIDHAVERLTADVKLFEAAVWFGGATCGTDDDPYHGKQRSFLRKRGSLQATVEDSPHRTLADKIHGITVTCQEMAGRCLIELETPKARLTLITAAHEQAPRMGIQGIDGTEEDCRDMLERVRGSWQYLNLKKA